MADKTLTIASFKYGLDTRRAAMAALPGTLQTAQNVAVNSGAELIKRKAFVKDANLFPTNTFGFQDTDSGPMVFGSDAAPNAALPTGVVYQRLQSPYGGTMSGVVFSTSFLGKAFVIATYATGDAYVFYDGAIVPQITDGKVGISSIAVLSTILAAAVNRIPGWLAHANVTGNQKYTAPPDTPSVGYRETALQGSTLIMSPVGVHFTPVIVNNNSAAGLLGVRLIDQNYPGVPASSANSVFTINAGTAGTLDVQAPLASDGSNIQSITNGPVTLSLGTTLPTFALQVAYAINNYSYVTGYTAVAGAQTVTVYAPPEFGAVFNTPPSAVTLDVITTGDVTTNGTGTAGLQFTVTLTPPNLAVVVQRSGTTGGSSLVQGSIACSAVGNNGSVTYTWTLDHIVTEPNGPIAWGTNGNLGVVPAVGPTCSFAAALFPGQNAQAYFNLKAQDATTTINRSVFVNLACNKV